jgi:hypothetical protein
MKKQLALSLLILISFVACKKDNGDVVLTKTVGFEGLSLGASGYWNGADGSGKFTSNGVTFSNSFSSSYGSWDSFAYSQKADVANGSYTNQYSVFDAANGLNKFAIYYPPFDGDAFASFAKDSVYKVTTVSVCNSTYTALTLKNGDPSFAKKFGGASGNDKDWYKMTVVGFGAKGDSLKSVEFYLADYRFDDNSKDYIVKNWTNLDLSSLGKVNKLTFRFSSTDNGTWGMNTPSYVCLDNLKYEVVIPGIR